MSRRDTEIALFRAALAETPDLWRALDIRVIAVRLNDAWHNLLMRCVLDARAPEDIPPLPNLPETPIIGCWHEVMPAAALESLLDALRSKRMTVAGHLIELRPLSQSHDSVGFNDQPYQDAYAAISARLPSASSIAVPQEVVGHRLQVRPGSATRSLPALVDGGDRAIDQTLNALEHPWDGLAGLGRVAVGSSHDLARADSPIVEIVAPLGAAFDQESMRLRAGSLRADVSVASATAAQRCTVGYVAEREDGTYENGTVQLKERWRGRRERRAHFSLSLGSLTRRVTLLLRVGPHLVDRAEAMDQSARTSNPHLAAYLVMDPGLARLRKALQITEAEARGAKEKELQRQFERAVAQLFSLAGFHADALGGYDGVQDAVDVLVRNTDGDVLFPIECTLGALSSKTGKPNRLMARTDELRRARTLADADITPMMITSRPRGAVPKGDLEFVAHDQMIVLCQEELQALVDMIDRGGTASDVIRFCRQHAPQTAVTADGALQFLRGRHR
jgi:hypothetical protein